MHEIKFNIVYTHIAIVFKDPFVNNEPREE